MTSLLLLADSGYGGQAMVLARTLFEDTVVAWWCEGRQTTELLGLMESHEKSVALLLQRESPGRGDFETLATVPVLKEEDLAALSEEDNVDVRRARGLWTGQSVAAMVREVESSLSPEDAATLRQVFDVAYLLSNLAVHHLPLSNGSTLMVNAVDPGGVHYLSRQPSSLPVHDALAVAHRSFSLVTRLVCPSERSDELDGILRQDRPVFVVVNRSSGSVGRNEPCPCGSGRKWKHCHGGRSIRAPHRTCNRITA